MRTHSFLFCRFSLAVCRGPSETLSPSILVFSVRVLPSLRPASTPDEQRPEVAIGAGHQIPTLTTSRRHVWRGRLCTTGSWRAVNNGRTPFVVTALVIDPQPQPRSCGTGLV
jgi:hypothetical protein